ncbi:Fc.00g092840.m01.CDS01 [Cosmosporella sp. VM-42]
MHDKHGRGECEYEDFVQPQAHGDKSLQVQLVLSLLIGVTAFLAFCFLRPRWPALYAARKRHLESSTGLPSLSNSTFGWILQLYKVTEEQVLASAGLDAFVFLAFFKMSTKLFAIMAFFATVVLWPINTHYRDFRLDLGGGNHSDPGDDGNEAFYNPLYSPTQVAVPGPGLVDLFKGKDDHDKSFELTYLWSYVVFTYFFTGLTIYYMNRETFRIIRYRQEYLGSQSTVTDRTFRLTGIPEDLRSEGRIKNLIDKLDIGRVDNVTICRDWQQLDGLMDMRDVTLRNLEASWAKYLQYRREKDKKGTAQGPIRHQSTQNSRQEQDDEDSGENGQLLDNDPSQPDWSEEGRPMTKIHYGPLGWRSRKVDAIDYYEERLRRLDAKIFEARKKDYTPTDMALVTMDSVASCQMVIQARIDPRPGRLLTKITPAPSDLVWRNTYAPRGIRRLKSWAVTIFITILTIVWIFPTAFLASLLSICAIRTAAPEFARWLQRHSIIYPLVQNGVPTLVVSLLNVAVPYLYDWLSNCQGMISQGDVELSVISKNFFFTFFNTFFVFAISRTGIDFFSVLQGFLKDTSKIPAAIAKDVEQLSLFYISFIMLQAIGLMPVRILEVGSVFLYPFLRMMSKTPRDFAELKQPPVFQYGFYLPTALLVFNLCLIYSVLSWGFAILIIGVLYFSLGYFFFKYMVLYAMVQPQHATGGAWRIICYRVIIGLVVFEVVMVGQIASSAAFIQSVVVLPLIPFTIWYSYYIKQRFEPLTKYIALRAIRADEDSEDDAAMDDAFAEEGPRPSRHVLRRGSTLDEYKEKGLTFVNPSLVDPLQRPWIYDDPPPDLTDDDTTSTGERSPLVLNGAESSLGIGDANVWASGGENNV